MNTADLRRRGPWPRWPPRQEWLRVARQTGNPLLRLPSRRERIVRRLVWWALVLVGVAVVGGCLLVYTSGTATERAQADRRSVTVTVVGSRESSTTGNVYLSDALLRVTYEVNGESREGVLPSAFGAATGANLHAWIDRNGDLVPRPQTRPATVAQTSLAAVGALVLLTSLALGCRTGLAAWSARLRSAEWDAEWLLLDTGRFP